ncbi:MAG: hypothetical protein ACKOPT_13560 [Cyanobium sp.]
MPRRSRASPSCSSEPWRGGLAFDQRGEHLDGATGIAAFQSPDAKPVARFAGARLQRFGSGQGGDGAVR